MNYSIDLSPLLSAQLTQAARMRGTDPAKVLESLVAEYGLYSRNGKNRTLRPIAEKSSY